jgi:acetyltransferase-like isoleucine patch superfamily enzyme
MDHEEVPMIVKEAKNLWKKRKLRGYSLAYSLKSVLFIFLYDCVRYIPTPVGEIFRFLVLKMFCKKIQSIWIRAGTNFFFPENISIGRRVSINDNVYLDGYGGIEFGDDSGAAVGSVLISEDHEISDPNVVMKEQPKTPGKITVGKNVWIASNCTILKGVTIGEGSVVAAGSVLTRSVPPYTLVGGNPARVIRSIKKKDPEEEQVRQGE